MKRNLILVSMLLLSSVVSSSTASGQAVLYRETFGREAATGNQNLPLWDWQRFNAAGTSSGSATGGGGVSGDGDGGRPIDLANTETAGPNGDGTFNVYAEGWQYMDGTQRLTMTTEYTFDPAAAAPVTFRWWQGAAYPAGSDPLLNQARIAVRVGGAWYVSNQFFTNTPVGSGAEFDTGAEEKFLPYDPAAANWLTLNFNGDYDPLTNTATASSLGDITIGAPATSALTGAITGFGLYRAVTGSNMRLDNYTIEGDGPQPGDVDGDEDVDMDDFAIIRDNFQKTAAGRQFGDLDANGVVNWIDFRQWKNNFPFPAGAAGAAIPEPSGMMMALLAIVAASVGRRR